MGKHCFGGEEAKAEQVGVVRAEKTEGGFKSKNESLMPPKRKLVKKMVCDCIVQCVCDKFSKMGLPSTASDSKQGSSVVHPCSSQRGD